MKQLRRIPFTELPDEYKMEPRAKSIVDLSGHAPERIYAVVELDAFGSVHRLVTTGCADPDRWDKIPLP